MNRYPQQMIWLPEDQVVFAGYSITDAGRESDPDGFGAGYVRRIAETMAARHPRLRVDVVNRGIGGNTIRDLRERWTNDILSLRPAWISIMIGINDVWRRLGCGDAADAVPLEEFAEHYRDLVVSAEGIGSRLMLCETSVIEEDPSSEGNRLLTGYNDVIRRIAGEHDAVLVEVHREFLRAVEWRPDLQWTTDGVHPTPIGHALIAEVVLQTVGA